MLFTIAPGAPGYVTPGEAAERAPDALSEYVDSLDVSAMTDELFEATAPDLEAHINVHQLPSGSYLIESIEFCYTGPDLGPIYPEDMGPGSDIGDA